MATKKQPAKTSNKKSAKKSGAAPDRGAAAFPYTLRPGSLRRFLGEVPNRPRPTKINRDFLAAMNLAGGDNMSIIRVLKTVGLVSSAGEPTDAYTGFMHAGSGPGVLATLIKRLYAPLFEASLSPCQESQESLRNLFNINSGGATIDLQIQTFRALCDFADFTAITNNATGPSASSGQPARPGGAVNNASGGPSVHIDLHIHMPPGRSSREYQYIIQDIARYLYGVGDTAESDVRAE